jgi:hypothetical protein
MVQYYSIVVKNYEIMVKNYVIQVKLCNCGKKPMKLW